MLPLTADLFDGSRGDDDDCFFTSVDDYIKHIEEHFHFGFNTSLLDTMVDDISRNFENCEPTSSTSLPTGLSIFNDIDDDMFPADGELFADCNDDVNIDMLKASSSNGQIIEEVG
jgi:hypothetical protein